MTKTKRSQLVAVLFSALVFLTDGLADSMHVWIDAAGQKRISTIARNGFDAFGELRDAYNPNSLIYQHREMRKILAQQAAQIVAEQALTDETEALNPMPAHGVRVPKEGIMGLGDLIELERRGGRYQDH